jgi:dihydrofolate synthase/folylpolyglutamate synthase
LKEKGWALTEEKNKAALLKIKMLTGLRGRWEIIRKNPMVVLDVGHNVDGVTQILKQIEFIKKNVETEPTVHIVMGMVKDKEVEKVLTLFPSNYKFYFTNAHLPRAMPAKELQQKAALLGLTGNVFDNVNDGLKNAVLSSSVNDLIVVCGSVFVVGEVDTNRIKEY